MNLSKTGVGIGKYHESGVLDVSGDVYANNGLLLLSAASNAETDAGLVSNKAVTPASLKEANGIFQGTVSASWTYGQPSVTIPGFGTVSADIGFMDLNVRPGSSVVMSRTLGDVFTIIGVRDNGPAYLRSVLLPPSSNFNYYDAGPGDPYFHYPELGASAQSHSPVSVVKSSSGWVSARGLYMSKGTVASGSLITTLPVGFRPLTTKRFSTVAGNAGGYLVYPDGRVVLEGSLNNVLSMANMLFNVCGGR